MARADAPDEAEGAGAVEEAAAADRVHPTSAGGEPLSFEAAMARLEAVVDRLEGGELELEVALASFEEGVRLTRYCAEQLDAAERRIELLMKEGDDWVARPFGEETGDDESDAEVGED